MIPERQGPLLCSPRSPDGPPTPPEHPLAFVLGALVRQILVDAQVRLGPHAWRSDGGAIEIDWSASGSFVRAEPAEGEQRVRFTWCLVDRTGGLSPAVGRGDRAAAREALQPYSGAGPPLELRCSVERFAALAEVCELRLELLNGLIVGMAGASHNHNLIASNLGFSLNTAFRPRGCRVFQSDQYVAIDQSRSLPDLVLLCGAPQLVGQALTNPTAIIEILSPSTASKDRTEKLEIYCGIPTLKEYLLVHPDRRRVERARLKHCPPCWEVLDADVVELLGVVVSLDEIYDGVGLKDSTR